MVPARRKSDPYQLIVGMTGVKLGDAFVQIGCAHGGRLAAVAAKVGLSGRAAVAVPDEASAARARKGAEEAGVLLEIETTSLAQLPFDADSFEFAIVDDTGGLLTAMAVERRVPVLREALRVLRPGGRALVVSALPATGFSALFTRRTAEPLDVQPLLDSGGFTLSRVLGEREGLRFTEAVKKRNL